MFFSRMKVEKPVPDEALVTCEMDADETIVYNETNAAKANALTDAIVAAGLLGVWFGPNA